MALTIGELVGYLRLDDKDWTRGILKADKDLEGLRSKSDAAAAAMVSLALSMAKVGTTVPLIASAATTVGAMAGALAVLPAAGIATAIAMKTAALGMQGFGEAMDNISDPAAFAESISTLTPAAREAAVAVRSLAPAWKAVQQSVQEELFAGVGDTIGMLGEVYMPILSSGLTDVARSFDNAHIGMRIFGLEAQTQADVASIFDATSTAVGNVGTATGSLLRIFRDLVVVGSEFLPDLTSGFSGAAERAADFVSAARESGRLHEWIATGLATLSQLGQLLQDIGAIIGTVFDAFDAAGAGTLTTLLNLTGQLREFFESAEGQSALVALATTLSTVASVVTDVVMVALHELVPIVIELAPAFAELAGIVGGALIDALQIAGPLLQVLAAFLADNVTWLAPLALGLFAAAKALGILAVAIRVVNVALMMNPWVLIIAAVIAVVMVIVTYWDEIVAFLSKVWNKIRAVAETVWGAITGAVEDAVAGIKTAIAWVAGLPGMIGEWFSGLVKAAGARLDELVGWFSRLPGQILDALLALPGLLFQAFVDVHVWALRAVVDGLHWIVVQVALLPFRLIGALINLGQLLWQLFTDGWALMLTAFVIGVQAVIDFVIGLPGRIVEAVSALGGLLATWAVEAWTWARTTVVDGVNAIVTFVAELPQRTISAIASLGRRLWEWASNAWREALNGVIQVGGQIVEWVKALPGKILDAVVGFGRLLYQAGRDLLAGLIDGIVSMVSAVINEVISIGQDILSGISSALGIASPSKEMHKIGVYAGRGLALGLASMASDVAAAAGDLSVAATIPTPRQDIGLGLAPAGATAGFGGLPGGASIDKLINVEHLDMTEAISPREVSEELAWRLESIGG
ncbi:phage tail protein [Actinokineospora sp.]|uniref:phage tail protein n=1 Tax=Actinokineospora sp. TaxID=1872133 RepID=UPI003D6AA766